MSLPPGFLDELRSRSSLSQVVGRKVMWDARKSNQAKGDMWAPCPFHQEKSASFHVDDRKGFYYCFGCHAKGDAISFVRESENLGFMEAVELLAREAGMPIPARDPQAQVKADRRTVLADVMEQAVRFFRLQLNTGAAAEARAYLGRRGLDADALERWEIGFAPNQWQGLWDHLKAKDIADDLILAAGLAKPSTKGGKPYDIFRNRIIFPIRDARGRAIAFGGRALDPNDNAKYLNSPETELFDKGRSLFNQGPARTAAGRGQPLVVAEGYMDVIALASHGFEAAVAPLGTAITETQLQMLWRISPEPIVALDGDAAGLRAAMRLIDLALPLLEAGRSLRFAIMPQGKDPDDLLREQGAGAFRKRLDEALPMVRLLWQRETEGRSFDSPERKAALDKALREKIMLIRDPSIRHHYGQEIKDLRWQLFRPSSGRKNTTRGRSGVVGPRPETKNSLLVQTRDNRSGEYLREIIILAVCAKQPEIVAQFEPDLESFDLLERDHQTILLAILENHAGHGRGDLISRLREVVGADALEKIFSNPHVAVNPAIKNPEDVELGKSTLAEQLAKLSSERGLREEIEEAEFEMTGDAGEGVTWRLAQAAEVRNRSETLESDDKTIFERAESGVLMDRAEREKFDSILSSISFTPKRRS